MILFPIVIAMPCSLFNSALLISFSFIKSIDLNIVIKLSLFNRNTMKNAAYLNLDLLLFLGPNLQNEISHWNHYFILYKQKNLSNFKRTIIYSKHFLMHTGPPGILDWYSKDFPGEGAGASGRVSSAP